MARRPGRAQERLLGRVRAGGRRSAAGRHGPQVHPERLAGRHGRTSVRRRLRRSGADGAGGRTRPGQRQHTAWPGRPDQTRKQRSGPMSNGPRAIEGAPFAEGPRIPGRAPAGEPEAAPPAREGRPAALPAPEPLRHEQPGSNGASQTAVNGATTAPAPNAATRSVPASSVRSRDAALDQAEQRRPSPARPADPDEVKIGLWGSTASGKTTFLAALRHAMGRRRAWADGRSSRATIFPRKCWSTSPTPWSCGRSFRRRHPWLPRWNCSGISSASSATALPAGAALAVPS